MGTGNPNRIARPGRTVPMWQICARQRVEARAKEATRIRRSRPYLRQPVSPALLAVVTYCDGLMQLRLGFPLNRWDS